MLSFNVLYNSFWLALPYVGIAYVMDSWVTFKQNDSHTWLGRNLDFFKRLNLFAKLLTTCCRWGIQLKFWSSVTPRSLVLALYSMIDSPIKMAGSGPISRALESNITSHLQGCGVRRLLIHQVNSTKIPNRCDQHYTTKLSRIWACFLKKLLEVNTSSTNTMLIDTFAFQSRLSLL